MPELGICMAVRYFDCILCQRHFSRMTADLILPDDMLCDDCLAELCQLEGDDLRKRVSERLARTVSQDKEFENGIVSAIQWHNQQRTQAHPDKNFQKKPEIEK